MIAKAMEGSITKAYLKKLRLRQGGYAWAEAGGLIRNYGPTIIDLLLKIIKPATRIGVSNLKDEIEKATLAKFGNNEKDLLDYISSNFSIIIDKVERHKDYVRHIFRDIFSGPNSTFSRFIEITNYD